LQQEKATSAFFNALTSNETVSSYDRPTIRPNFSYMPPRQAIAALIKHQHRPQLPNYKA